MKEKKRRRQTLGRIFYILILNEYKNDLYNQNNEESKREKEKRKLITMRKNPKELIQIITIKAKK